MNDQLPPGFSYTGEIGRGGFAVVHRAVQDAVGRDVAIKIINETTVSDDVARRFRRECVAVGQLSWHPHIAQVFDAGETPTGRSYMVFEYLPNGSLGDRLDQGPLDETSAVEYAIQISDAVAAAHSQDVLHRDIKPDNVLLDRLGRAKLADFGIADMRDGTRTATGTVTATIFFAAPEILSGARADQRSDVYGLAATLHTLLAGTSPFEGSGDTDIIAIIGRIATKPPPDLRSSGVSAAVADVVAKGLEKSPEDRYQSAAEFGRALQKAQQTAGRDTVAMPYTDRLVSESDTPATAPPEPVAQPTAEVPPQQSAPAPAPATPSPGAQEADAATTAPRAAEPAARVAAPSPAQADATRIHSAEPTPPPSYPAKSTDAGSSGGGSKVLAGVGALVLAAAIAGGAYFAFGNSGDGESEVAVEASPTTEVAAPDAAEFVSPEPTAEEEEVDSAAPLVPARLATGEGITVEGNWERTDIDCSSLGLFEAADPAPTCHRVDVPENWEAPGDNRVQLAFAVLPPLSGQATQPPVVFFSGGPGQRMLSFASEGFADGLFDPLRADREVLIFDQRGAGESTPVLSCPEYAGTTADDNTGLVRATDACFRRLTDSGINLRAYSAAAMAHDVEAILQSLDWDDIAILGQSYGTRAALTFMRIYGDDIDAVVFDSTRPVEYNISSTRRPDFERAMRVVFDTCAQSNCGSRYPDLEGQLDAVTAQLRANPIDVPATGPNGEDAVQRVSDQEFARFLHGMLYSTNTIWVIPNMIAELSRGGSAVLSQVITNTFAGLSFTEAGQLLVVNCNDELAFEDPLDVSAQRDDSIYGLLADSPTSGFSFEDCDSLPPFDPDPIENEPVRSSVPTLLLGGRFDPLLPPAASESAAAGLSNSEVITFPWLGHGVSGNQCGLDLMAAFLDDPRGNLDTSCVDAQPPIEYP